MRPCEEEAAIATAFDMRVQNELDRFHPMQDVVDRLQRQGSKGVCLKQTVGIGSSNPGLAYADTARICRKFATGNRIQDRT